MKNLAVSLFFVIALIVFFYVIDRKEFIRNNEVQQAQTELQEINRKPASDSMSDPESTAGRNMVETRIEPESQLVAKTKPNDNSFELKSQTGTKLGAVHDPATEEKPVVEIKPADTKSVVVCRNMRTFEMADC